MYDDHKSATHWYSPRCNLLATARNGRIDSEPLNITTAAVLKQYGKYFIMGLYADTTWRRQWVARLAALAAAA
jgi:hypothetical protein